MCKAGRLPGTQACVRAVGRILWPLAGPPTSARARPATVALVSADAEFSRNPILGAKANAKKYDFNTVHEAAYPLTTKDFTPVIDAVAESNCDLLFLCSYLADSIRLGRTIHAHRFRPKMVGGGMIGPQNTVVKTTLGPLLNGFVNYEYWQPVPEMSFPGVEQLLNTYQTRAGEVGVDLLGHYMAPLAYAQLQVVARAVEATGGFGDTRLAAYARSTTFDTGHDTSSTFRSIRLRPLVGATALVASGNHGNSKSDQTSARWR